MLLKYTVESIPDIAFLPHTLFHLSGQYYRSIKICVVDIKLVKIVLVALYFFILNCATLSIALICLCAVSILTHYIFVEKVNDMH